MSRLDHRSIRSIGRVRKPKVAKVARIPRKLFTRCCPVIRGGCRDDGGGGGSSSRLSRTRRFINVVTSCRRYCRGVSVTTEADVAFLIKRSRRQGSLHCVRIVGGDVGKGLVLTTRPASLYNPAVDQFQSTTTTAIWRERERKSSTACLFSRQTIEFSLPRSRPFPLFSSTTATLADGRRDDRFLL